MNDRDLLRKRQKDQLNHEDFSITEILWEDLLNPEFSLCNNNYRQKKALQKCFLIEYSLIHKQIRFFIRIFY